MTQLVESDLAELKILRKEYAHLKGQFPEIFKAGRLDLDKLADMLAAVKECEFTEDPYHFNWFGKSAAHGLAVKKPRTACVPSKVESRDWQSTGNIFIEGDNLDALKHLRSFYESKIKMIYIDPPYNTGKEFLYKDSFCGAKPKGGLSAADFGKDGRHAGWLSMIYPRLLLAKDLLTADGLIFISIDDHEQANLRRICDEIFGSEQFLGQIIVQSNKRGQTYKNIAKCHEYLLVYGKSAAAVLRSLPKAELLPFKDDVGHYDLWELRNRNPKFGRFNRPNLFYPVFVNPEASCEGGLNPVSLDQDSDYCVAVLPLNSRGEEGCWRWSRDKVSEDGLRVEPPIVCARKKRSGGWNIYTKSRKSTTSAKSIWLDTKFINERGTVEARKLGMERLLEFPKPLELLKQCIKLGTDKGDIVLDFFAGTGTTAHGVMLQNQEDGGCRKFICVQLPEPTYYEKGGERFAKPHSKYAYTKGFETIADICKERLKKAGDLLRGDPSSNKYDVGFRVFKLLGHENIDGSSELINMDPGEIDSGSELITDC